jgi:hypothetical protein
MFLQSGEKNKMTDEQLLLLIQKIHKESYKNELGVPVINVNNLFGIINDVFGVKQ